MRTEVWGRPWLHRPLTTLRLGHVKNALAGEGRLAAAGVRNCPALLVVDGGSNDGRPTCGEIADCGRGGSVERGVAAALPGTRLTRCLKTGHSYLGGSMPDVLIARLAGSQGS